jgi:hypothetical protein
MLSVLASLALGAVLLGAAALKLADRAGTQAALATYGVRDARVADIGWAALVALEIGLAVGVAAGVERAAMAAAVLMAAFASVQGLALLAGRAGAPCACLGARGRLGAASLARTAALAAAFAALPLLPHSSPGAEGWMAIGLGVALLGLAALGVAVLALAREVGALRLALGPQGALEVPEEGPEVGGRTALVEDFADELIPGRLGLAVFTSEGCRMCRALAPAVDAFARDPRIVLREYDEERDAAAWALADVPGSPFAVALDAGGTVLAKGTFNTAAQLESVLAAAERRRRALVDDG